VLLNEQAYRHVLYNSPFQVSWDFMEYTSRAQSGNQMFAVFMGCLFVCLFVCVVFFFFSQAKTGTVHSRRPQPLPSQFPHSYHLLLSLPPPLLVYNDMWPTWFKKSQLNVVRIISHEAIILLLFSFPVWYVSLFHR
jgi:hypothetical protein